MSEDKLLKRKRSSIKGQITVFKNYLSTVDITNLNSLKVMELQLRTNKFEGIYEEFDNVQTQIECTLEDIQPELDERCSVETQYYSVLAEAKDLLNKCSKGDDDIKSCNSSRQPVKLPIIQLPKFSGSYDNWLEFRDTFGSLVHSSDDIDSINKFHYLRSSLEGSAAIVIQSIEFSGKNYKLAWDLLCERYDNKRLLIQNHVSALFNMESLSRESSLLLKRLIDNINKNIRALQSLGEPVQSWDTLLIHIFCNKLDTKAFREWEQCKGNIDKNSPITLNHFLEFLRNRADFIETLERSRNSTSVSQSGNAHRPIPKINTFLSMDTSSQSGSSCPKCNEHHKLNLCPQFLALNVKDRLKSLRSCKVCYNCFSTSHFANNCKKRGCKTCKRKHNTLIHDSDFKNNQIIPNQSDSSSDANNQRVALTVNLVPGPSTINAPNVLLSTALIKLYDLNNREILARALLDSGSSSCILTENMFKNLNLPYVNINKTIEGVNKSQNKITKVCTVKLKSLNNIFSMSVECYVLPTITSNIPLQSVNLCNLKIPSNINLADPNFHEPAAIDMIIGADVFWDILQQGKISLGVDKPTLCETKLGWLVCGSIKNNYILTSTTPLKCNFINIKTPEVDDIESHLIKFWQLEEVSRQSSMFSDEERSCEEHYVKNTSRLSDGRFCVKIPLKKPSEVLGDSFDKAKRYFYSLERRNQSKPAFNQLYKDFMSEYLNLGHMTECHPKSSVDKRPYFIPHHGVLRELSSTTKLRVVFNASSPTSSGLSLNNIQMVGPTIQDDLLAILLRFRLYKYVLSADVEKMYRQVTVHPSDRHLQQIIWRDDPSHDLKVYQLNTVTYGTASAPFLATRCLRQIGLECNDVKIAEVILHDFYVDDLLTGSDDINDAMLLRQRVSAALASGCMPLRKWRSNEPKLLSDNSFQSSVDLNIGSTDPSKTLGLTWLTCTDELSFPVQAIVMSPKLKTFTKREILSIIGQIFDPLGLLSPCIILMKMFLQKLWLQKLSWDDQLPQELHNLFKTIISKLPEVNNLHISRHVSCSLPKSLQLHIFTDASEQAYGACLYVRSVDENEIISVKLLTAKSRVAPVKSITIPRLELCGALVGAKLYQKVVSSLRFKITHIYFWTDSMIVLGWLKMLPIKLNTFVRNRVSEINEITNSYSWRYVPTSENPSDLLSRGVTGDKMQSLDLWWYGPRFLHQDTSAWPHVNNGHVDLPEIKSEVVLLTAVTDKHVEQNFIKFERFSSLLKLKHSVAYVLKFIALCKKQNVNKNIETSDELQKALNLIIIQSQLESFPEYKILLKNKNLPFKSPLLKFSPFLDDNKIMRVGGRLFNSKFSFEKKHPILIQSTHHFSKLLFRHEHIRLLHAGPQQLLATIREEYWPIGGRNLAKLCYRQCVLCRRIKGQTVIPQMGNLPLERVSIAAYPFQNVGVDYAGPIMSASRQGRGCRLTKVYIVIFVCFAVKAIHLELVGDLTSNNYLQALRRFMSRRGKPLNLYSDNGTSFVGAYHELSKFLKVNCDSITQIVADDGISFHFMPAYTPHFGGLWEAGVKSTKYHLVRVLGNCNFTYEELNTALIQIEALLNSRPLSPLSSNPEDLLPLTPGHFLIGRPLTSLPVKDVMEQSRLCRFERIEQIRQHFWARWSKEYIAELQQRSKWRTSKNSLQKDTLVVIKDNNLPPLKWKLGRIVDLHPGHDGISRVADIRTSTGIIRRAFSNICPLLDDPDDQINSG